MNRVLMTVVCYNRQIQRATRPCAAHEPTVKPEMLYIQSSVFISRPYASRSKCLERNELSNPSQTLSSVALWWTSSSMSVLFRCNENTWNIVTLLFITITVTI